MDKRVIDILRRLSGKPIDPAPSQGVLFEDRSGEIAEAGPDGRLFPSAGNHHLAAAIELAMAVGHGRRAL